MCVCKFQQSQHKQVPYVHKEIQNPEAIKEIKQMAEIKGTPVSSQQHLWNPRSRNTTRTKQPEKVIKKAISSYASSEKEGLACAKLVKKKLELRSSLKI